MSEHAKILEISSISWTNSFACINAKATPYNWPVRSLSSVHEFPSEIQPTVYLSTAGSKFRCSIMNHAQELERLKQTSKGVGATKTTKKNRRSLDAVAEVSSDSEMPLVKRLKNVKTAVIHRGKQEADASISTRISKVPVGSTGLSTTTFNKLHAFRYSSQSNQPRQWSKSLSRDEPAIFCDTLVDQSTESIPMARTDVSKHDSSGLMQAMMDDTAGGLGTLTANNHETVQDQFREQPVQVSRLAQLENRKDGPPKDAGSRSRDKMKEYSSSSVRIRTDTAKDSFRLSGARTSPHSFRQQFLPDNLTPQTPPHLCYKILDCEKRFITTFKTETTSASKQANYELSEHHQNWHAPDAKYTPANDYLLNVGDLDDSFFDSPALVGSIIEDEPATTVNRQTEVDSTDDSVFEQLLAEDRAECQKETTPAQVKMNYLNIDAVGPLTKPILMLPAKPPIPATLPMTVSNQDEQEEVIQRNTLFAPFLRLASTELVTSSSTIPNLNPAGRVITCFRIAELLRELSSAPSVSIFELFVNVTASARNRDSTSQSFIFADLFFPQRPPYIHGIYAKCSESELFDDDSRFFLKAGRAGQAILARTVVTPRIKPGKQPMWDQRYGLPAGEEPGTCKEVEVLSIFTCAPEDIQYTKGIVMPEKEVQIREETEEESCQKPAKKRNGDTLKPVTQHYRALSGKSSNIPSSTTTRDWKQPVTSRYRKNDIPAMQR